jgi:hypothetical protein
MEQFIGAPTALATIAAARTASAVVVVVVGRVVGVVAGRLGPLGDETSTRPSARTSVPIVSGVFAVHFGNGLPANLLDRIAAFLDGIAAFPGPILGIVEEGFGSVDAEDGELSGTHAVDYSVALDLFLFATMPQDIQDDRLREETWREVAIILR